MIELTLAETEKTKNIYFEYHIPYNENSLAFYAKENEEVLGYCIFMKSGEILNVCSDYNMMKMPLLKAAMNWMDLNGVETAFSFNENISVLLMGAKFRKDGNKYIVKLAGYFTEGC